MISNGGKSHGILYAFIYKHSTEVHLPSKNKLHACLQQEMGVSWPTLCISSQVHAKGTFTYQGLFTCKSTARKGVASHDLPRINCIHVMSSTRNRGASDDLLSASVHKYTCTYQEHVVCMFSTPKKRTNKIRTQHGYLV